MSWLKWIKTAANVSTGGLSSLYLYGGLFIAGAAAFAGASLWHGAQVREVRDTAFKAGQAEVSERWQRARTDAAAKQAERSEQATEDFIAEVEVVKTVYVDRIKEIKTYVPSPNTSCPADPGFLQRYNAPAAPIGAGDTQDQ